jgi:hypothetical protein
MYGQTNCWVHPDIQYIAFITAIGQGEVFVCTRRAARNMAYQGFTKEDGKLDVLLELTGQVINELINQFLDHFFLLISHRMFHLRSIFNGTFFCLFKNMSSCIAIC